MSQFTKDADIILGPNAMRIINERTIVAISRDKKANFVSWKNVLIFSYRRRDMCAFSIIYKIHLMFPY